VKAAYLIPMFQTIERTEVPHPGTLIIHTKQPDVLIPARLAFGGQMIPWSYIDRVGYTAFNQRPVGTGPLRFVSWTSGDRCVLEANPDYRDGRLDLDRVIFRAEESQATLGVDRRKPVGRMSWQLQSPHWTAYARTSTTAHSSSSGGRFGATY
jgi:ABC-type transport system substrate-binding protein